MSKSLRQHGPQEIHKHLRLAMKNHGLDIIKVLVTRRARKIKIAFPGSTEEVEKGGQILAAWA